MKVRSRMFRRATNALISYALGQSGVSGLIGKLLLEQFIREVKQNSLVGTELSEQLVQLVHLLVGAGYIPAGGIVGKDEYLRLMPDRFRVGPLPERYMSPGIPEGECPFGPTTITLSLGTKFVGLRPLKYYDLMKRPWKEYLADPEYSFLRELQPGEIVAILPRGMSVYERFVLEEELRNEYGDRLKLVVVGFLNGQTLQKVEFFLPSASGETAYAGLITNITRIARFGVDVEKAPRLHTGDCHAITLEFDNNGPSAFLLTAAEQPVANLTIVPVIGAPSTSESQVRGQIDPSGYNDRLILPGAGAIVLPDVAAA